jgi:hypothetical protein
VCDVLTFESFTTARGSSKHGSLCGLIGLEKITKICFVKDILVSLRFMNHVAYTASNYLLISNAKLWRIQGGEVVANFKASPWHLLGEIEENRNEFRISGHGAEIRPVTFCPVPTARSLRCLNVSYTVVYFFWLLINLYEVNETLTRYPLECFRWFIFCLNLQLVGNVKVTALPPLFCEWNILLFPISNFAHLG